MCHFRESIPVTLKNEIDHCARESELPYLFNKIHPRTIIVDPYCTNPALMVLMLLPVTVKLYQADVGRKATASIPVWSLQGH